VALCRVRGGPSQAEVAGLIALKHYVAQMHPLKENTLRKVICSIIIALSLSACTASVPKASDPPRQPIRSYEEALIYLESYREAYYERGLIDAGDYITSRIPRLRSVPIGALDGYVAGVAARAGSAGQTRCSILGEDVVCR
jgi:hypothetical protein